MRWVPAVLCFLMGLLMAVHEFSPGSGPAGALRSQPSGAALRRAGSDHLLGYTPLKVQGSQALELSLWGHRSQRVEAPYPEQVRLQPKAWYTALFLAGPWLLGVGWLGLLAWLNRQQRRLQAGANREEAERLDPKVGSKVGPYLVEKRVGEGTQAEVFLARDPEGQAVALKVLFRHVCKDPEFRIRFEREVDSGMLLDHPNIIKVLRWSLLDGRYWMAQPFYLRGSLAEEIRPGGLPPSRCRDILTGLARALDYAHERKVIHRDLKPSNVLIDEEGQPVLADFGVARARRYETITQENSLLGTPTYMAPEQGQGEAVTPLSDLYSLGVLGYELLTGKVPFEGDALVVIIAHINQTPPPLSGDHPLHGVVMKLLEKDPLARYPGARALLEALQALPA